MKFFLVLVFYGGMWLNAMSLPFKLQKSEPLRSAASSDKISIDLKDPYMPVISVNCLIPAKSNTLAQEEGRKQLAVYMVTEEGVSDIPLSGKYHVRSKKLFFTPMNKLGEKMQFEVRYFLNGDTLKKRFKTPALVINDPPVSVSHIYPATDIVPSNILLFYIEFSGSMNPDETAYRHIKLLNSRGEEQKMVWRQKSYWLKDNRILAMMIHPGRVKRGLSSLSDLGNVFSEGETYTLVVTADVKDQYNRPVTAEFRKSFSVAPPDRACPAFSKIVSPKPGTSGDLMILFSEGMDYASVWDGVRVTLRSPEQKIKGEIIKGENDRTWYFRPAEKWKNTDYSVTFQTNVSDYCGNTLYTRFEIEDLKELEKEKTLITISFRPDKAYEAGNFK